MTLLLFFKFCENLRATASCFAVARCQPLSQQTQSVIPNPPPFQAGEESAVYPIRMTTKSVRPNRGCRILCGFSKGLPAWAGAVFDSDFSFPPILATNSTDRQKLPTRVIPNPAAFSRRVRNLLFDASSRRAISSGCGGE